MVLRFYVLTAFMIVHTFQCFVLVYHISFKEYEDHNIERQTVLVYLTIIDVSVTFFPLFNYESYCNYKLPITILLTIMS